jgi:hypothetical protein
MPEHSQLACERFYSDSLIQGCRINKTLLLLSKDGIQLFKERSPVL